jgi:hypothetical protein
MIRPKHYVVTNYWLQYYANEHCTLCGNSGVIDTTGVTTGVGLLVGRKNFCICPNGQALRSVQIKRSLKTLNEVTKQP